jgi:hypothetical protein
MSRVISRIRHRAAHPDWEMTMKGSKAMRCLGATLGLLAVATASLASDPNPPRDPRAQGLRPVWAGTLGDEVLRVDRLSDGRPSRCVRAARLATPAEGGPSRLEFGVERASPETADVTMYFRIQYLDAPNGRPLPVRDPVLEVWRFGPTSDWRVETSAGGWIRRSKALAASSRVERLGFANETKRVGNEVVSTFPDGTHRLHELRGGVSPWHFEMHWNCVCRMLADLPKPATDGFPCG